jgi:hypothetical protein
MHGIAGETKSFKMTAHCTDQWADRIAGSETEIKWAKFLLVHHRKIIAAHSNVIDFLGLSEIEYLPDHSPGDMLHLNRADNVVLSEIKAKYATDFGSYGLEKYRLDAIVNSLGLNYKKAIYVIFDTKEMKWMVADFAHLMFYADETVLSGASYYGDRKIITPICYWPTYMWKILDLVESLR